MNKRIENKKLKNRLRDKSTGSVRLEGNKGYDVFTLTPLQDDRCHLFVGKAGVVVIDSIIPSEIFVDILVDWKLKYNTVEEFVANNLMMNEDYKNYLLGKVYTGEDGEW